MRLIEWMSWHCLEAGPLPRLVFDVMSSKLSGIFMGLCTAFVCASGMDRLGSFETAKVAIMNISSCYSANASLAVVRQGRLSSVLQELQSLVQEAEAWPGDKKWAERTLRGVAMLSTMTVSFAVLVVASLCADMGLADDPQLSLWPFVPHAGPWGAPCGRLFWGCWTLLAVFTICYVVASFWLCAAAAAGLHDALGLRLLAPGGATAEEVRDVVATHRKLRLAVLELTEYAAGKLVHVLSSSFCSSLFATVLVLGGDASAATLSLLVPAFVVFLPLAHYSQEMSDASLSLARSAYHASTDGVEHREARALLLVMLAAAKTPALRCRGLGRFGRASMRHVFNQFYTAVNTLGSKE
ncbi:Odorant receptor 1 [Frankliniella occidentalis]|nr:Odorant receptor 1 [Frankliniella occidentalis]